jgi:hypothetical protein
MPDILLVNCPPGLRTALKDNADYRVFEVLRSERLEASSQHNLPDPRTFDIVIDDSSNVEPEGHPNFAVQGTIVVPKQYTDSLSDSDALIYVPFGRHGLESHGERYRYVQRRNQPAYLVPDWRPTGTMRYSDYFRSFLTEFDKVLEQVVFENPSGSPPLYDFVNIFENEHGYPRIFTFFAPGEHCRVLITPNFTSSEAKVRGCKHLLDNVFPFLVPQAYADVLVPSTVQALQDEWHAEQVHYRERMAQLEEALKAARAFYEPYKPVVRLLGDPLHQLVARIFREIWDLEVTNLDEQADAAGERRRADLLVQQEGWRGLVEVTGAGRRTATFDTDLDPFLDHIQFHQDKLGPMDARILVYNHHTSRSLSDRRTTLLPFSNDLPEDARAAGVTVMTAFDLFHTIELHQEGRLDIAGFVNALSKPGALALP